jgi:hypothetical protein
MSNQAKVPPTLTNKPTVRPYKFVVQAIVQRLDARGNVAGEIAGQPVELFGCDALGEWATTFPDRLVAEVANSPSSDTEIR